MKLYLNIRVNDVIHYYPLLSSLDFQVINVPDVVHLEIVKSHNHLYTFSAFFYSNKTLIWPHSYSSKKELHCALQKLLQQFL